MKRGRSNVNKCSLCENNEESVNHILIHCDKKRALYLIVSNIRFVGVPDFIEKSSSRIVT